MAGKQSQKGYDAEIISLDILEKQGYKIIYSQETSKRERIKVQTERKEMELEKKLESFGFCSQFVDKNKIVHRGTDIKKIIKFEEKNLKSKQKEEVLKLIKKWNENHKNAQNEFKIEQENMELLTNVIGKSIIPDIVKENHRKMIESEKEQPWKEFFKETLEQTSQHTFVDVFCKKNDDYYVFDIKYKIFKDKNSNRFYVTNYEVLNYAKIQKEKKVKLKIMIIVEKEKKLIYRIFDWSDFTIPITFDPHKKIKTSIRLTDGLDIESFTLIDTP